MKLGIWIDISCACGHPVGWGHQFAPAATCCKQHKYFLDVLDLNETWYTDRSGFKGVPFIGFVQIHRNLWIWRTVKTHSILPSRFL